MKQTLCALVAVAMAIFTSCGQKTSLSRIDLPSYSIIASDGRFALIVDPYVSLRDQPGESGITIAHGRRGDIFEISGKKTVEGDERRELWLDLGKGWVLSSSVELYSSRDTATTAASRFADEGDATP